VVESNVIESTGKEGHSSFARGPKKVVFLGATKGMGRAIARLYARRGDHLFLLGLEDGDLERTAADLGVDGVPPAGFAVADLSAPSTFEPALDAANRALSGFDTVVVTAGIFATQEQLEADPERAAKLLTIDFTNTILFCEAAKKRLLERGGGTLAVFSSVAGERARKPVIIYGATKAGLTHYLEGLDHKHARDGLKVVTVKPGFVKTGMTAGLKPPPFAGEVDDVAKRALAAIDRGTTEVYLPFAWGPIMRVIRSLPRFVMRRVGF
jgi:decaprenylphospho-beta-D-erythro-pentofuranosid-2-ulose 2-reductase